MQSKCLELEEEERRRVEGTRMQSSCLKFGGTRMQKKS